MDSRRSISLVNISFPTCLGASVYYYVPVGILYLSSSLQKEGFSVQVLDYQRHRSDDPYNPRSICSFLSGADEDIVGVSLMAKDLPHTLLALEMYKKENPSKIIILGGPGATGSAEGLMKRFSFIDYIIAGEGEITLTELMKAISDGASFGAIAGLVWRNGDLVTANPRRERITDLDALPRPAYELIDKSLYNYIYLPGARGCSHFCTFCDQPALWQGCEIKRSVKNLLDEMDYIRKELKADWGMAFSDNEFCHDPERFNEFTKELEKRRYNLPFSMDRRIDAIDDESLIRAGNVGCHSILYGIESGSDRVLKEIRKDFKAEAITPGLVLSAKYITSSVASFIFNYPFETLEDFLKTVNIIYPLFSMVTENHIIFQLHYLAPLPRTPIFAKYKDRLIRRNVSNLMTSKDNVATYDIINNDKTKKVLVLPKFTDCPIEEAPEVKKLVESDPLLFPSHYVYDSPHLHIKEKVIDALRLACPGGLSNLLFKGRDYYIHLGEQSVTVAGDGENQDFAAIFTRISAAKLDDPEKAAEPFRAYPDKTHIISIDLQDAEPNPELGKELLSLMRILRDEGIANILITYIPEEYASFIVRLRLAKEFGMPGEPHKGGDFCYIDENGYATTFDGEPFMDISTCRSKKALYRHFSACGKPSAKA